MRIMMNLTMLLIAMSVRPLWAATYNFNFYDGQEAQVPPTPANVTPVTSATPTDPTLVAQDTEKSDWRSQTLYSLGAFYYVRNKSKEQEKTSIGDVSGMGLRISLGKVGGTKLDLELTKEKSAIKTYYIDYDYYSRYHKFMIKSIIESYGPGINLKKEFMLSELVGLEFGVGGSYMRGKGETDTSGYPFSEQVTLQQQSVQALGAMNLYLKQVAINFGGRLAMNYTKVQDPLLGERKLKSKTPILMAGLSYAF